MSIPAIPGPPSKKATDFGLTSDMRGVNPFKGLPDLKLGPALVDPKLTREVQRETTTDIGANTGSADDVVATDSTLTHLISPQPHETLPYPMTLRTLDVAREVEKVREGRKRIKLGAEAFTLVEGAEVKVGGAARPSVCLFTLHDTGDRSVATLCLFPVGARR